MTLDTSNALFFLISCMKYCANLLNNYRFLTVTIWNFFIGFIFVGMVVSVFWRGARG